MDIFQGVLFCVPRSTNILPDLRNWTYILVCYVVLFLSHQQRWMLKSNVFASPFLGDNDVIDIQTQVVSSKQCYCLWNSLLKGWWWQKFGEITLKDTYSEIFVYWFYNIEIFTLLFVLTLNCKNNEIHGKQFINWNSLNKTSPSTISMFSLWAWSDLSKSQA